MLSRSSGFSLLFIASLGAVGCATEAPDEPTPTSENEDALSIRGSFSLERLRRYPISLPADFTRARVCVTNANAIRRAHPNDGPELEVTFAPPIGRTQRYPLIGITACIDVMSSPSSRVSGLIVRQPRGWVLATGTYEIDAPDPHPKTWPCEDIGGLCISAQSSQGTPKSCASVDLEDLADGHCAMHRAVCCKRPLPACQSLGGSCSWIECGFGSRPERHASCAAGGSCCVPSIPTPNPSPWRTWPEWTGRNKTRADLVVDDGGLHAVEICITGGLPNPTHRPYVLTVDAFGRTEKIELRREAGQPGDLRACRPFSGRAIWLERKLNTAPVGVLRQLN